MKTRVMIVDDSNFSRIMLGDILKDGNCEVVGEAGSIQTLIETYKTCKPDIVTMDIAMPGADGFECSKALLLQDKFAKIILVSSMKDEATEAEARKLGISGYLQKPVEAEHLLTMIKNVLSPDTNYQNLLTSSVGSFKEALNQSITKVTKSTVTIVDAETHGSTIVSKGITVVIGVIGRVSGTIVMDLSLETAEKMAEIIYNRKIKDKDEYLDMIAEFANVVGGIACSLVNKLDKSLLLRVTPPSLFYKSSTEASTEIINPSLQMNSITAKAKFGDINLSFGFKKESILWM